MVNLPHNDELFAMNELWLHDEIGDEDLARVRDHQIGLRAVEGSRSPISDVDASAAKQRLEESKARGEVNPTDYDTVFGLAQLGDPQAKALIGEQPDDWK